MVMEELIEAEATEKSAPRAMSAPSPGSPSAMAHVTGRWPPRPATWSSGSPGCTRGRTSRSSSNPAGASTRRSTRWSWRPTSAASPPAVSTTWSPPWGSTPVSPSPRSRGSALVSTRWSPRSANAVGPHRVSLRLPRRDLPPCPQCHLPDRVDGRGRRDRDHRRGGRESSISTSATARTRSFGEPSSPG